MMRMRCPLMPARRACGAAIAWLLLGCLGLAAHAARAEPYLAVRTGYKCAVCHVNPTGGGMRSNFGDTYAEVTLPA